MRRGRWTETEITEKMGNDRSDEVQGYDRVEQVQTHEPTNTARQPTKGKIRDKTTDKINKLPGTTGEQ